MQGRSGTQIGTQPPRAASRTSAVRNGAAWTALGIAEAGVALGAYEIADRLAGVILVLVLLVRGAGHG